MIPPKISVITPTYNTGESILVALTSVAGQSYRNVEHIIVDGGSEDDTLQVIGKFAKGHKNLRIESSPDKGIYDAMNKGLDLCTGEWIIFLGADDSFNDENTLKDIYDQGFLGEEQVVYGNVMIIGESKWAKDNTIYDGPFTLDKLFRWNICHQAVIYPRSVIKKVGYYELRYPVTADWDYNIRCWAKYKFTYVDKVIACFKAGGKSSGSGDAEFHSELIDNVIRYFNLDVNNYELYAPASPFYWIMSQYREREYLVIIRNLENEAGALKDRITEKDAAIENRIGEERAAQERARAAMEAAHNQALDRMRSEYDHSVGQLRADQERQLGGLKADNDSALRRMREETEKLVSDLTLGREQVVETLRNEHEKRISFFREEYDRHLSGLKDEYHRIIGDMRQENVNAVAGLKEEFSSAIGTLKHEHEQILSNIRDEHVRTISMIREEHAGSFATVKEAHSQAMSMVRQEHSQVIEDLKTEHQRVIAELKTASEQHTAILRDDHQTTVRLLRDGFGETLKKQEYAYQRIFDQMNVETAARDLRYHESVEKANAEILALHKELETHKQVLASMAASATWKAGRMVLAPLRLVFRKKETLQYDPWQHREELRGRVTDNSGNAGTDAGGH